MRGSAVLAAAFPDVGIGLLGVSLAFGLTVLTMAYAIGHISGCHLNPAVSVGLFTGGRFPAADLLPYVAAQVAGAVLGSAVLYVIASGAAGFSLAGGFAANGFAAHSPVAYPSPKGIIEFTKSGTRQLMRGLPDGARKRVAGIGIAAPFELWNWADEAGACQIEADAWRGC